MKIKVLIFLTSLLLAIGCNTAKESQQKRNLMMPGKSDLPRNDKYIPSKQKRTYKTKKKKKKKKRLTWMNPADETFSFYAEG